MKILAFESSCDETAAAVVEDGLTVLSDAVASQAEEHKKFGGVVPELASRRHCENILDVTRQALSQSGCGLGDIDAIAVTYAPGLIGALLVGTSFAKGLAMASGKPLVPVHHIAGHIAANYLSSGGELRPPFLCLVASGGHSHVIKVCSYTSYQVIGRTRDDAAGEAFDKAARAMGYPYPGGVYIDKAAQSGDPNSFQLPHPKIPENEYDFSFSGLKTAVLNIVHNAEQRGETLNRNDLAASFQRTVAEILVERTVRAAKEYGMGTVALAGGVAANSAVRALLETECRKNGLQVYMPELRYCGDNGAMIGCQAYYDYLAGRRADESLNAVATLPLDEISL